MGHVGQFFGCDTIELPVESTQKTHAGNPLGGRLTKLFDGGIVFATRLGKNFESTGGFGPELVTADELPAGARGLRIRSILNGKTMQDDNTANMIVSVADAIALISDCVTLEPGDVIVMGTPSGVGYARTPPVFMRAGDVCEIEIEGVGKLRNPIADEPA